MAASSSMVLVLLALLGGCRTDGSGQPDGGTDGAPRPPSGTPILERPIVLTHGCAGPAVVSEVAGGTVDWTIARWGEGYVVARVTLERSGEQSIDRLSISRPTFEPPALGDSLYAMTSDEPIDEVEILETEQGLAIAWVESAFPEETVKLVIIDNSGQSVLGPIIIERALGRVTSLALASSGERVHVIWADSSLRARSVDERGELGETRILHGDAVAGTRVVPRPEGWAIVWQQRDPAGVYLALLAQSGALEAGPIVVTDQVGEGLALQPPSVIALGDELIVAWSEADYGDPLASELAGHSIVRIIKLDASTGAAVGAIERLQAVEENILNDKPLLAEVNGQLALSWSRGAYIAICAGCVSDSKRHVMLIDPDELAPRSDEVIIAGNPGFSTVDQAAHDTGVALALGIDHHVISTMAVASVGCAPLQGRGPNP